MRCGSDVCYGANNIKRNKRYTYHTLTFTMKFPYDDDLVHLAHCHPYTYTDLQNQLHMLLKVGAARFTTVSPDLYRTF
jgi:hypothetical protein